MMKIDPVVVYGKWTSSIFSGITSLGMMTVIGISIQKVLNDFSQNGKFTTESLVVGIIAIGSFFFLRQVFSAIMEWREANFEDKIDYFLDQQQIDKLLSLDLGRLTDPEFLKTKELAISKGERAIRRLFETQMEIFSAVIAVIISLGVIAVIDPWLFVLGLLPVIPSTIKRLVIERKRRALYENNHLDRRRKEEYQWIITDKRMLVQARLFKFVSYMRSRYHYFLKKMKDAELQLQWFDFKMELMVSTIAIVCVLCIFFYLGKNIVAGTITVGEVFILFGSITTLTNSLRAFSGQSITLGSLSKDYEYRKKFFDTTPLIDESGATEFSCEKVPHLSLENVSFSYPHQKNKEALRGCSFSIAPCEKVAIIGRNGSGKTTAVRLAAKIFMPLKGSVTFDGISTSDILQQSLHEHLLYATQDSVLPDLAISEATTGAAMHYVDHERLQKAASMCGSNEFIKDLIDGYSTQIGEEWPGGVGFSSGQMQRLKITAALYRILDEDVRVGIFDEPMSNCDIETRELFYSSLKSFRNKTIIVIAHDPSYLHFFDRVIAMEDGAVIYDLKGREQIERYRSKIFSISEE